jgi:hypothetical protein
MPEIRGTHSAQIEREQRGYRWEWSGVQPGNVAPPPQIKTSAITVQEQPFHPGPCLFRGVGIPNVAALPQVKSLAVTVQERPVDLPARVGVGIQGPNVGPPITRAVFTRQEAPGEYQAFVRQSIQGPNVAAGIGSISVRQEQPDHPRSYLLGVVFPRNPILIGTSAITTQQQPENLAARIWPGTPPVPVFVPPVARQCFTVQEQPFHPSSAVGIGIQTPILFFNIRIYGYIGILHAPVNDPRQDIEESLNVLYQPYEFGMTALSNGAIPVTLGPSGFPLYADYSQILHIEVPNGRAIRYEINPVGRSVAASSNSPILTGSQCIEWGPGWSLSFIDAATAP